MSDITSKFLDITIRRPLGFKVFNNNEKKMISDSLFDCNINKVNDPLLGAEMIFSLDGCAKCFCN